ncbi:MAG: DUF2911 domain-containing protein [Bacteroidetes bacterium]|nr:DUF2911 domain-containing protein [Bacteroidota bacterium]MBS1633163.1 DUF2911 domain-containing protein [Bacteroidota bacterium]
MKQNFKYLVASLLLLASFTLAAQKNETISYNPNLVKDTAKRSIRSMAFTMLGKDSITISYYSPGVRNRVIWGGLVPYDKVWVTGAHNATTLNFPKAFVVNGKEIQAGKYALFTIPGKTEWIIIINKNWEQHLANEYDEKDDIVRVNVKPVKNEYTERLQYFVETGKRNKGTISMAWENLKIELPFSIRR